MASVAERYLLLGLRLGKHIDGLVDGYYGPPELQANVDTEEPMPPDALLEEARALGADAENEEDAQRRRWLAWNSTILISGRRRAPAWRRWSAEGAQDVLERRGEQFVGGFAGGLSA